MNVSETSNESTNNRNYIRAKKLVLIPLIVFVVTVICFILATVLEKPTNRGTVYSAVAIVSILSMFLSPLPCLIMSIIGTISAAKATKEGTEQAKKYLVIGVIEIVSCVLGVVLAILMFIGGQSV